ANWPEPKVVSVIPPTSEPPGSGELSGTVGSGIVGSGTVGSGIVGSGTVGSGWSTGGMGPLQLRSDAASSSIHSHSGSHAGSTSPTVPSGHGQGTSIERTRTSGVAPVATQSPPGSTSNQSVS